MEEASQSPCYAEPCCAGRHCTEHHLLYCYSGCCNAEFRIFIEQDIFNTVLSAVTLHVVMLSVMAPHNLVKNPIVFANTICTYRGIFIESYW